jgi:YHS domain-containing protein
MMSPAMPMEGMTASPGASPAAGMQRDPVCGMDVDPKTAPKSTHDGKTYYFCSTADKETFDKDPRKYANKP